MGSRLRLHLRKTSGEGGERKGWSQVTGGRRYRDGPAVAVGDRRLGSEREVRARGLGWEGKAREK